MFKMVEKLLLGTKKAYKAKKHQKSKKRWFCRRKVQVFQKVHATPRGLFIVILTQLEELYLSKMEPAAENFFGKKWGRLENFEKMTKTGREGTRWVVTAVYRSQAILAYLTQLGELYLSTSEISKNGSKLRNF